ncbi:MAG: hypothetical protein ONB06_10930 [candidate division KSB1 bacterium]|nr:hypothetical protein [candidate division KSB1 bacterium]
MSEGIGWFGYMPGGVRAGRPEGCVSASQAFWEGGDLDAVCEHDDFHNDYDDGAWCDHDDNVSVRAWM